MRQTSCCGIRDYNGLADWQMTPEGLIEGFKDVYSRFYAMHGGQGWRSGAHIIFSAASQDRHIPRVAQFITDNALGDVTQPPRVHNPNSGHNLDMLVFTPDHNVFQQWFDQQIAREEEERREAEANRQIRVGDSVTNIYPTARRNGQRGTVTNIVDGTIAVRYADGGTGSGRATSYELNRN